MFPAILATVRRIPKGKVATYGDVAKAAGFPGAARQVVWALRTSKTVPWQRVIGAKGKIRLPGQAGLEQRLLLRSEGVAFTGDRINMDESGHTFGTALKKTPGTLKRGKSRIRKDSV